MLSVADLSSARFVRAVADESGLRLSSCEDVRRLRAREERPDDLREAVSRLFRRFDRVLDVEFVRVEATD